MEVRNCVYSTTDSSRVDCEINHPVRGWIPTTVDLVKDDRPALLATVKGGDVGAYVEPPEPTVEELEAEAKAKRTQLMSETDWYLVRQLETGEAAPVAVLEYRQALRDITAQPVYPYSIVWPELVI